MQIIDAWKTIQILVVGLMVVMLMAVAGCASNKKDKTVTAPSVEGSGVPALYYDFGDVLVPRELKVDKKSSFIYQTEGFSAGVLVLKGRIDSSSLISFFDRNMAKDNWQMISSFKSDRTMLLFQKAHRWCVMNINDETFNTYVEIWVAPTTKGSASGLLE
ncbi:MAG: hypothetical protein JRE62_09610 [Deltaproteobacteria bacterium]|jgi:hypothetical protein|nr:hypothetical protein [Deltaproteobacteria bacterium]